MAHYAFLDENNIVTEVISGKDETELIDGLDPETWYGNFRGQVCKRTSYNTLKNVHVNGGVPFRGNYAGIGYFYDEDKDIFISPKDYSNYVFNEDTCWWEPPFPPPDSSKMWRWNDETVAWE